MASFVRCWLIRGLIVAVLGAGGFGVWVAVNWVSPETVRAAVLDHLNGVFGGSVEVKVESAAVRVFGGIRVTNVTLTRPGEAEPFAVIPSAVIYHDKQELNRGKLSVRKVELESPTLRVTRNRDGTWSLPKLPPAAADDHASPTVVVKDATLIVTDADPDGFPAVAFKGVKLHLVNDPQPVFKIDGQCTALPAEALDADGKFDPSGFVVPLSLKAKWDRASKQLSAHVELAELTLRPELGPLFQRVHPGLARVVGGLSGKATVTADLTAAAEGGTPPTVALKVELKDGRFDDAALPKPVEKLAGTVRLKNGKVTTDKLTGKLGTADIELTHLETKPLFGPAAAPAAFGPRVRPATALDLMRPTPDPPDGDPMEALERRLDRFEIAVRGLSLDDEMVMRLAPNGDRLKKQFSPTGMVDVKVLFTRPDGGWRREVDVLPNRTAVTYENFPYLVTDLGGSLKRVNASDGTDELRVQVSGTLGGRRVNVSGLVSGDGPDPHIDLKITGTDIPIDERLIAALPPKYAAALGKMRAGGRGDFVVTVREPLGVNRVENTFRIRVYDGQLNYVHFPYALSRIRGNVMVRVSSSDTDRPTVSRVEEDTDRVELRNFEAAHDGGRLWLAGETETAPGTGDRKLTLRVQGENCPIDQAFKDGLRELKLEAAVRSLNPRGDLTFGADVEIWDRGRKPADLAVATPAAAPGVAPAAALLPAEPPFNPATDLKLAFNFKGPTVTPTFFAYDLHNLSGVLRYHGGRLEMVRFAARHGATEVKLDAGEVRFADGGGVWANVGGMTFTPLVPDAAFLKALPAKMRSGLKELNLRGGAELHVKHLVVKVTPGEPPAVARGQEPALPERWKPATPGGPRPDAEANPVSAPPPPPDDLPDAVVYWNAVLKLSGAAMDAGLQWDDVTGSIATEGRYEGTHLGAVTGTIWLDKATVSKQPITAVKVPYRVFAQEPDPQKPGTFKPSAVEFRDLSAKLFQGTVGGQARVVLSDPVRYRLYLTASGVKLDEFARHYKLATGAELRGLAQGNILVENVPDAKTGRLVTVGGGQVDVPQGRMYNLPVLLDLVKVLKGQQPDGCAFEEAHATFDLKGDRIRVTQLDLLGSAVSLGGAGELDTDGEYVQFEFYTIWSQTLKRWLTTPLGDVTGLLSGSLFKIELSRENGKLTPKARMVPVVTDPVRAVAERLRNRFGPTAPAPPAVRAAPGR